MLRRYVFKFRNKWGRVCICIVLILCLAYYMTRKGPNEQDIYERQLEAISRVLSIHNITCQEPQRAKQNCDSVLKLANRFPRMLMIGFGKSGTRALTNFLMIHPAINGPPVEVNYFDNYYLTEGLQSYLETFPPVKQYVANLEKSPSYIISPDTPIRLKSVLKMLSIPTEKIKIIVMMRDPIVRAMSEYLDWQIQRLREYQPLPSFDQMVLNGEEIPKFISTSEYDVHISNWLKYFALEQFCFVDGDKFIRDPFPVMRELEKCLGLQTYYQSQNFVFNTEKSFYCLNTERGIQCLGKSKGREHPEILEETKQHLKKHFYSHNVRLNRLINREYPWSKQQ